MKSKFFFVIYPGSEFIKSILDGMRVIADPSQRNFSHITVKGPYITAQKKRLMEDNQLIKGQEIQVLGAGNFFVDRQNTVFFKCEDNEELYKVWKSKKGRTYKEFHPHITIYDGDDRDFACKLYQTINIFNIHFHFIAKELEIYASAHKKQMYNLRTQVNYSFISAVTKIMISQDNIDSLSESQRILAIRRLCKTLKTISNHKSGVTHQPNV
jgi:2'-5' RNA ligase